MARSMYFGARPRKTPSASRGRPFINSSTSHSSIGFAQPVLTTASGDPTTSPDSAKSASTRCRSRSTLRNRSRSRLAIFRLSSGSMFLMSSLDTTTFRPLTPRGSTRLSLVPAPADAMTLLHLDSGPDTKDRHVETPRTRMTNYTIIISFPITLVNYPRQAGLTTPCYHMIFH